MSGEIFKKQLREEEKRERLRMKFMKPEELAKIHEREVFTSIAYKL